MHGRFTLYYSDSRHRTIHKYATFFMFVALAVESLIDYAEAFYYEGDLVFRISLEPDKIAFTLIYFTVALLIGLKVRYKFLLIPDFFLLLLKLYTAVKALLSLISFEGFSLLEPECCALAETFTENLLFSLFLIVLFTGKLSHLAQKAHDRLPFLCLLTLAVCIPFTLFFESVSFVQQLITAENTTALSLFNFVRGILNEFFLDMPYALLIILLFFIPEKGKQ